MTTLTLTFLGQFQVWLDDRQVIAFETDKVRALLAYLAIEADRPHSRSNLAALLWPGYTEESARTTLRHVLHQLRQTINDAAASPSFLIITRQALQFNPNAAYSLDVATFDDLLQRVNTHAHTHLAQCPACLQALRQVVDLYQGDFLAGLMIQDSAPFEEWRRIRQEQFHVQAVDALHQLTDAYEGNGDFELARHYAQRQVELEPWREVAHRQLMRALAHSGDRSGAIAQYHTCRQILVQELNIAPDAATTALYEQIRSGAYPDRGQPNAEFGVLNSEYRTLRIQNSGVPSGPRIQDWGEMPAIDSFHGRMSELAELEGWLLGARLVAVLGMGGVGKTALAARVVQQVADQFEFVIWRSLLNAPPLDEILRSWLQILSRQHLIDLPASLDEQVRLLLDYLRQQRCLLVLDNGESILQAGAATGAAGDIRPGYEGYAYLLERLGASDHRSCLMLTSREQPRALARLIGQTHASGRVRLLYLSGLDVQAGRTILQGHGLSAMPATADALIEHYSGNPLALQIVANTIVDLFNGDIAAFQREDTPVFDNIRAVLDQQFARLSELERELLIWLAIEREAVSVQTLRSNLVQPIRGHELLESLQALQRRSLLEQSGEGVTLQNVVIEYVTDYLIDQVCREIETNAEFGAQRAPQNAEYSELRIPHSELNRYALTKAQAKEYVRQSQLRLILEPMAERLVTRMGKEGLVAAIRRLLDRLRIETPLTPGYAAGNLLNLLIHLGIDVAGYNFSHLCVWQANLRDVIAQRIDFTGANLARSLFAESFGFIYGVAISPDGSLVAAAASSEEIRLWRLADGALLRVFRGHQGMVKSVAFSPTGGTLVSGGDDHTVRIWDIEQDQALLTLSDHSSNVLYIAISPDGASIASASADHTIRLWALPSGKPLAVFYGHEGWVRGVAFSPDGKQVASASYDRTVRLWDVQSGRLLAVLQGHTGIVSAVAFHPGGGLLASASTDGTVRLWDLHTFTSHALQGHGGGFWSTAFSPDGTVLAGGGSEKVYLWEIDSAPGWSQEPPRPARVLSGHTSSVQGVTFTPDSRTIVSGSGDQTLRLWDTQTGQIRQVWQGHSQAVQSIAFSPDAATLAASSCDRLIRLWHLPSGEVRRTLAGHVQTIESIAISPDGSLLASGSADGSARLWALHDQQMDVASSSRLLPATGAGVASVAFSPDGLRLATASQEQIHLWNIESGQLSHTLSGYRAVYAVAFHPNGSVLATGHTDNLIRLWDVQSGTLLDTLSGHTGIIWSLAFSPNGDLLASGSFDFTVRLWQLVLPAPGAHPNARTSAIYGEFGMAPNRPNGVRDRLGREQARLYATLSGHRERVFSVAFSPDNAFLVSGSGDRTVRLWSTKTQQSLYTFTGHQHWIWSVAISPDGRTIASGSIDETIRLWDSRTGGCIGVLCAPGPYEGMDITGVTGITEAQRAALKVLGARESTI